MRTISLFLAFAAFLAVTHVAQAKMAFITPEDRVARSELIVLGKVTAVTDLEVDKVQFKKLEIAVSDTLKGQAPKILVLLIDVNIRRNTIPAVGEEHLFLLKPKGAEKDVPYILAVNFTTFSVVPAGEAADYRKIIAQQKNASTRP